MNREKMREQIRNLRAKKSNRPLAPPEKDKEVRVPTPTPTPTPKPQIKRGVVKVESLSSKRSTPTQAAKDKAARKRHVDIMRSAQKKHGGGCGGCRRKSGG